MNRCCQSLILSFLLFCLLPAHPYEQQSSDGILTPSCISGWIETDPQDMESKHCIQATNCTENTTFKITNTTCPSFMEKASTAFSEGEARVGLRFRVDEKEYEVVPDKAINSQPPADDQAKSNANSTIDTVNGNNYQENAQIYRLFGYILHGYELARKVHQIRQGKDITHHVTFLAYYLAGAAIHIVKTPLLQLIDDVSYMAPLFLYAGLTIGSSIAYKFDCDCGCSCSSQTPFQKTYRYINPHTIMLVMNAAAFVGLTR